jgi:D-alanyl-D-alanine carboxypeptidase
VSRLTAHITRDLLTIAATSIVTTTPSCSTARGGATDTALVTFVDSIAAGAIRDKVAPSLTIAVARGSELVVSKSYGIADIEHAVPATTETIYRIGSISKQFTAAMIMRLVEQRRVALDDDVTKYLPQFHTHGAHVTVRQLLNHTSGLQSFTELPEAAAVEKLDLSDAQQLALFQDKPANFAPGTNFVYNNSAFYMLAMVVERVTGQPHGRYLRDSVLVPLGLRSTDVCSHSRIVQHRARGYVLVNNEFENEPYISFTQPKGGGDLCSAVRDLVTWARLLASGKVVSAESYAMMSTPGTLADGREIGYGLGLFASTLDGTPEVFHGGSIVGFTSFVAWYPAHDLTIAIFGNSDVSELYNGRLARQIGRRALGMSEPRDSGVAATADELSGYAGTYRAGSTQIAVTVDSARLLPRSGTAWQMWGGPYYHKGNGVFASVGNPAYEMHFTAPSGGARPTRLSLTHGGRAFGDFVR